MDTNNSYEYLNTYILKSETHYKNREFYEALKEIDKVIEISKNNEMYMKKKHELIEKLNSLDDSNKHYIGNKYEDAGKCSEAIIWYLKSKSLSRSLYRIGIIYYFGGIDVEKNTKKAFECFKSAIKMGNIPAAELMLNYYMEKDSCANLVRAKRYLKMIERVDEKKYEEYKEKIERRLSQKSPIGSIIGYLDIYKFAMIPTLIFFMSFIFVFNEYGMYLNYKKLPVAKNIDIYINGEIASDEKTLFLSEKYEVEESIKFKPFYAPEQSVEYIVDHEQIVDLKEKSLIPLKEGETKLSMIHDGKVIKTIKIKVEKPKDIIEFNEEMSKKLAYVGDITNIDFNISNNYGKEIDFNNVEITSSNVEVIEIKKNENNGNFTAYANKEGSSVLTIKYGDMEVTKKFSIIGTRYSIETELKSSKYSKEQSAGELKMLKGETLELSYKIKDNKENKYIKEAIKVEIDDKKILKQEAKDSKEVLYFKGAELGKTKVQLEYKSIKKDVFIEVVEKKDEMKISENSENGVNISSFDEIGEVLKLSITGESNYKEENTDKKIKVQAINESVKVSQNGNNVSIEALKSGETGVIISYGSEKKELKFKIKEAAYIKSTFKGSIEIKVTDENKSMNSSYILKGEETKHFSDKSTKTEGMTENIIESINLKVDDAKYNDGEVNSKMSFERYQKYLNENPECVTEYNKANLIIEVKLKGSDKVYSLSLNEKNSYTGTIAFEM